MAWLAVSGTVNVHQDELYTVEMHMLMTAAMMQGPLHLNLDVHRLDLGMMSML